MKPRERFATGFLAVVLLWYGIGFCWLRWGNTAGFDTRWGWTGVRVEDAHTGYPPQHGNTGQLVIYLFGSRWRMLEGDTCCYCPRCQERQNSNTIKDKGGIDRDRSENVQ